MPWPEPYAPPLVTIHPWTLDSIGSSLVLLGASNSLNNTASATFPAANDALLIPFSIAILWRAVKMFVVNGATVSGNIDVGIYSEDLTRLVSIGSTAQSGTNAIQEFNITDTELPPGNYFMAVAMDNTTGTIFFNAFIGLTEIRASGLCKQASAFALPATITPVAPTSVRVPIVGITGRSVV